MGFWDWFQIGFSVTMLLFSAWIIFWTPRHIQHRARARGAYMLGTIVPVMEREMAMAKKILTPKELKELSSKGYLTVQGRRKKNRKGSIYRVTVCRYIFRDTKAGWEMRGVFVPDAPPLDNILALKMALEHDETPILNIACGGGYVGKRSPLWNEFRVVSKMLYPGL